MSSSSTCPKVEGGVTLAEVAWPTADPTVLLPDWWRRLLSSPSDSLDPFLYPSGRTEHHIALLYQVLAQRFPQSQPLLRPPPPMARAKSLIHCHDNTYTWPQETLTDWRIRICHTTRMSPTAINCLASCMRPVGQSETFLHLGCGDGSLVHHLALMIPFRHLIGYEMRTEALVHAIRLKEAIDHAFWRYPRLLEDVAITNRAEMVMGRQYSVILVDDVDADDKFIKWLDHHLFACTLGTRLIITFRSPHDHYPHLRPYEASAEVLQWQRHLAIARGRVAPPVYFSQPIASHETHGH